jgi:4-hydroxy-tetrahydrodipicolinate reductase
MKIALLGYGKMGKEIEQIALALKHEVILKIDDSNLHELTLENLKKADVAIEFTTPKSAVANILKCFEANVPVVVGTTGWLDKLEEIKKICVEKNQAFFYASNFSIGVNLFFRLNVYLARLMKDHPEYFASMEEIHHIHKKDEPSGTGISLAEGILKEHVGLEGEVPGTHMISYTSKVDEIKISHEAYSRKGFAEGAVHAAIWLVDKKGVFGMKDMLGI